MAGGLLIRYLAEDGSALEMVTATGRTWLVRRCNVEDDPEDEASWSAWMATYHTDEVEVEPRMLKEAMRLDEEGRATRGLPRPTTQRLDDDDLHRIKVVLGWR